MLLRVDSFALERDFSAFVEFDAREQRIIRLERAITDYIVSPSGVNCSLHSCENRNELFITFLESEYDRSSYIRQLAATSFSL